VPTDKIVDYYEAVILQRIDEKLPESDEDEEEEAEDEHSEQEEEDKGYSEDDGLWKFHKAPLFAFVCIYIYGLIGETCDYANEDGLRSLTRCEIILRPL
jgi:hypothetical protein